MAIAVGRLGRGHRDDVPINLLPAEIRAGHRMRRVFVGMLIGVGALVVGLGGYTVVQRQAISSAQADLRLQRAEAARLRSQVGSLRQFGEMQARIDATRGTLAVALRGDVAWTRFLNDLAVTVPSDSWLVTLNVSANAGQTPEGEAALGQAKYTGFVTTFPGLSGWLTRMSELEGLRFVYLNSGTKQDLNGAKVVSFSADAYLTEVMLSGRCQTESAQCP